MRPAPESSQPGSGLEAADTEPKSNAHTPRPFPERRLSPLRPSAGWRGDRPAWRWGSGPAPTGLLLGQLGFQPKHQPSPHWARTLLARLTPHVWVTRPQDGNLPESSALGAPLQGRVRAGLSAARGPTGPISGRPRRDQTGGRARGRPSSGRAPGKAPFTCSGGSGGS